MSKKFNDRLVMGAYGFRVSAFYASSSPGRSTRVLDRACAVLVSVAWADSAREYWAKIYRVRDAIRMNRKESEAELILARALSSNFSPRTPPRRAAFRNGWTLIKGEVILQSDRKNARLAR
jgi:hypothetical protein